MRSLVECQPLTPQDVAKIMKCSVKTILNWRHAKEIPEPAWIGGRRYWHPEVFYAWLDAKLKDMTGSAARVPNDASSSAALEAPAPAQEQAPEPMQPNTVSGLNLLVHGETAASSLQFRHLTDQGGSAPASSGLRIEDGPSLLCDPPARRHADVVADSCDAKPTRRRSRVGTNQSSAGSRARSSSALVLAELNR